MLSLRKINEMLNRAVEDFNDNLVIDENVCKHIELVNKLLWDSKAPELRIPMEVPANIEKHRKSLVFARRRRIKITKLVVSPAYDKEGNPTGEPSVVTSIEIINSSYGFDNLEKSKFVKYGIARLIDGNGSEIEMDNACGELFIVEFQRIDDSKSMTRRIAKWMTKGFWILKGRQYKGGYAIVVQKGDGTYYALNNAKIDHLNDEGWLDAQVDSGDAIMAKYFVDTPSQVRKGTTLCIKVPKDNRKEWKPWIERALNCATGGMYYVLKAAYAGRKLPVSKAIKLVGRESFCMTPSTSYGEIKNMVIYCGDKTAKVQLKRVDLFIESDELYTYYEVADSPHDIVAGDGAGEVSAEYIVDTFYKLYKMRISKKEAKQFAGQMRINSFIKGHNIIVDRKDIFNKIQHMMDSGKVKGIIYLKRTRKAGELFEKLKDVPVEKGGYKGCLVVFGAMSKVEYFGDLTCVKCSSDFSKPFELRLMDIAHTPKGFLPLSKQGLNQMQMAPNFTTTWRTIAPVAIDRIKHEVPVDEVEELRDEYTDIDVQNSQYNITTIQRLCNGSARDDVSLKDKTIRRIWIQSLADTINKRLNVCNLIVSGKYLKLVPDIGADFDVSLLDEDEFYVKNWKRIPDETGYDAVIIRYPLIDLGAFIKGHAVSREEIIRRINALPFNDKIKQTMIHYLDALSSANMMVGSCNIGVTNKMSGADFDGDGVCAYTDVNVKKAYAHLRSYSNDFGGSIASDKEFYFDYDLGPISFEYAWALDDSGDEPNPPIGVIAGYNVTVCALLAMLYSKQLMPVQIFRYFLGKKAVPGVCEYNRQFNADGSNDLWADISFVGKEHDYADRIMAEAMSCKWTYENCERFLWDMNAVLSKCMNDIIDAAKTAARVPVPFIKEIKGSVRSSAVASSEYAHVELARTGLKIKSFHNICESAKSIAEQQKVTILKNDPIGNMKRYIFNLAKKMLEDLLKQPVESDIKAISGGAQLDSSLDTLCSFFVGAMSSMSNDRAFIKRKIIGMAYKLIDDAMITDPEAVLGIVYRASIPKDGTSPTSFYAQFTEIITHYVSTLIPNKRFEMNVYKYGGGIAYVGQKIVLEDGHSEDGFFVDSTKISGEFTLEMNEYGKPIISRKVIDMIKRPEVDKDVAVFRIFNPNGKDNKPLEKDFTAEGKIALIEQFRRDPNFVMECKVLAADGKRYLTSEELNRNINLTGTRGVLLADYTGRDSKPLFRLAYFETPEGTSTYLKAVANRKYIIESALRMAKDQDKNYVGVVAKAVQ